MDDVRYKSTDKVMSEYQWLRKGFFIKDTAVGIDGWNNRFCTYPLTRFTADEVYEDTERAKERLSKIRHEYYIAAREKKKYWDWFEEFREDMKTQYQWFHEENRVPLETAKWYNGESLNKRYNTCSFGSDYYYCHRDDTKEIVKPTEWDGQYHRYCKVQIDEGVILWYRTEDNALKANDTVIVPYGVFNSRITGTIISVDDYRTDELPFPIEVTKKIIGRADLIF